MLRTTALESLMPEHVLDGLWGMIPKAKVFGSILQKIGLLVLNEMSFSTRTTLPWLFKAIRSV